MVSHSDASLQTVRGSRQLRFSSALFRERPAGHSSWSLPNTAVSLHQPAPAYSRIIPVLGYIVNPLALSIGGGDGRRKDADGRSGHSCASVDHRLLGIDPEGPDGRADEQQAGGDAEWSDPGASGDEIAEHRWGKRADELAAHVHHAGDGAGKFAADVHGDGPGG